MGPELVYYIPNTPWDCHMTADQAKGGARGVCLGRHILAVPWVVSGYTGRTERAKGPVVGTWSRPNWYLREWVQDGTHSCFFLMSAVYFGWSAVRNSYYSPVFRLLLGSKVGLSPATPRSGVIPERTPSLSDKFIGSTEQPLFYSGLQPMNRMFYYI